MRKEEFKELARDSDRLNGWKAIASFVNCDRRTAQRWETERQLPVRRQERPNGRPIVFALKGELSAWSQSGRLREKPPADMPGPQVETPLPPSPAPATHAGWWPNAAVIVIVAVVGVVYFTGSFASPARKQPAGAIVESRSLVALDANGGRLWTRELDFEPNLTNYSTRANSGLGMESLLVVDLDNDGTNEVVLTIASVGVKGTQGYRVFDADGALRFAIEPSDHVMFGDEEFAGPWAVYRMFVVENPDRTRSIWTAFIHGLYFPSLLLEVDRAGRINSKYWSNGYVEQLEVATIAGRRRVLVGATNNDTRGASLAIFDYGKVRGSAPATKPRFQCTTCEPGGPEQFLVFPRHCIAEAVAGQAAVQVIRHDARGRLFVFAGEGPRNDNGEFYSGAWYTVDPALERSSMQFAPGSSFLHRTLEQQGRLDHPFSSPSHLSDPGTLLKWDVAGFTHVRIQNLTPKGLAPGS